MIQSNSQSSACCQLCCRVTKQGTTQHHLIPRTCHSNKWFKKNFSRERMRETISVCRECHSAIHKFVPKEKDLGRYYNTVEDLMAHEEIAVFVHWVSKQR